MANFSIKADILKLQGGFRDKPQREDGNKTLSDYPC